jgi:PTH1 family peptidyl-tRNA hydrolase
VKLIVGLGNPGAEYAATRHNVGFRAVRRVASARHIAIRSRRADALVGDGRIGGVPVRLALPQTFMNRSGLAVRALCRAADVGPEAVLVVCDEVQLLTGQLRLRAGGSAGGHRGLQSMIDALGSDRFARLRIGVGAPAAGEPMRDRVLGAFPVAERPIIAQAIEQAAAVVETWVTEGVEAAMNRWNAAGVRQP